MIIDHLRIDARASPTTYEPLRRPMACFKYFTTVFVTRFVIYESYAHK